MNRTNTLKTILLIATLFVIAWLTAIVRAGNQDVIVGVWQVKTDYYQAIYEIESYDGSFVGKVHYYNDGQTEIKENKDNMYFISDLNKQGERYVAGKMYMPDGSYYEFNVDPIGEDHLKISMTVDSQAYSEDWFRYQKDSSSTL